MFLWLYPEPDVASAEEHINPPSFRRQHQVRLLIAGAIIVCVASLAVLRFGSEPGPGSSQLARPAVATIEPARGDASLTPDGLHAPDAPEAKPPGPGNRDRARATPVPADWPALNGPLPSGDCEVQIHNTTAGARLAGVRAGGAGKDFVMGAREVRSVFVPRGTYEVYSATVDDIRTPPQHRTVVVAQDVVPVSLDSGL